MTIKKYKNHNIHLIPDGKMILEQILYNDAMFWKDLYFESFESGWWYIVDYSTGYVYSFTDYGYNHFEDLQEGKKVILKSCGLVGDYEVDHM